MRTPASPSLSRAPRRFPVSMEDDTHTPELLLILAFAVFLKKSFIGILILKITCTKILTY
jgi:hypothetical protein